MNTTLSKIDLLSHSLSDLLPIERTFQQRLDKKIRMEFNYNSNHLEGNTLTYGETELLLIFGKTTNNHELREYEEMKAHDVAFSLIKEWAADSERPLTEATLRELHKKLLVQPYWKEAQTPDGQATRRQIQVGAYKSFPNSVRLQNGEIFHYASPEETPILMAELVQWYQEEENKQELHPVQLAALLHYRFVRIHPFDDGNGRMSRLLMNYVLLKHNLPPVIVKSADKKNYLSALNQADTGNEEAFVEYIAKQLVWSLELYIKAAKTESLEEDDDLRKEISIWKKEVMTNKSDILLRNNMLVYDLYHYGGIVEMFKDFEQQHHLFYEMFHSNELFISNGLAIWATLEKFEEAVNTLILYITDGSTNASHVQKTATKQDMFESIGIMVYLHKYLRNQSLPFNIESQLILDLKPYHYSIICGDKELAKKKYNEYLTSDERKKIVRDAVRDTFRVIKSRSEIKPE